MKFVSVVVTPFTVPSGTAFVYVALDEEGEIWWLDTNEKVPDGPNWHPLPIHPRQPSNKPTGRKRRRR